MAIPTGRYGLVKDGNIIFSPRHLKGNEKEFSYTAGKYGIPKDNIIRGEETTNRGVSFLREYMVKDEPVSFPDSKYSGEEVFYDPIKNRICLRKKKVTLDTNSLKSTLMESVEKDKKNIEENIIIEIGGHTFLLNDKFLSDLSFGEAILSRGLSDKDMVVDSNGVPLEVTKAQFVTIYKTAFEVRFKLLKALREYLDLQESVTSLEECVANRKLLAEKTDTILKKSYARLKNRRR